MPHSCKEFMDSQCAMGQRSSLFSCEDGSVSKNREVAMQSKKRHLLTASMISGLLLQAACGGGGGDGGSGATPPGGGDGSTPPLSATVSGTAAKGLLLDAIVTFYPVSNGVVGGTALATVRTDSSTGAFSSPVPSSGAVVATLTVDGSTQMLDELAGVPTAAPAALVLHAVFPSLTNLQPLAITPLTELAYTLATSGTGGLSVATIDAANSTVSTVFLNGAPVLQTLPIDIANYASSTPAQQAQAKLLTALSVAADKSIATGTDGLACMGSYPENLPCVVDGLGRLVSVSASGVTTLNAEAGYLSAAYAVINSGAVTVAGRTPAELGMNVPTTAENALVENIQEQNPLPGYNPSADPLVNTKDLMANIRTNIVNQGPIDTLGFSDTLDGLVDDFENNVKPVGGSASRVLASAYFCALAVSGDSDSITDDSNCRYDPLDPAAANTAFDEYAYSYEYSYETGENGSYSQTSTERWIQATITRVGDTGYSVSTRPFERIWSFNAVCSAPGSCEYGNESSEAALDVPAMTATFTLVKTGDVRSASFSGPFYVTAAGGHVSANLQAAQSEDWNNESFSGSLTVSGTLFEGGGGISLKSAKLGSGTLIHVRNGKTATDGVFYPEITHTYTDPYDPEVTYSWTERDGLPRTIAGNAAIAIWGAIDMEQWVTDGFSYAGKVTLDEPVYDASNTLGIPGTVKLEASISEVLPGGAYAPLFQGALSVGMLGVAGFDATQPIVATNSLTAQMQADGTLFLPSGRILSVSATANADRPTSEHAQDESGEYTWGTSPEHPASFSVTYRYSTAAGTAELNASGEYDSTAGLTGTITNNAGVTIAVSKPADGPLTGTVTANGVETATIGDNGFVFYSDGSSESVF